VDKEIEMLALVLSGAANYGAMQAGALEALAEVGFEPQIVVGTSAGALNAIYFSYDPSPDGALRLQSLWRAAGPNEVGVPKPLSAIRRLVMRRDSLVTNENLLNFLTTNLPSEVKNFGQLERLHGVRAYTVAVCMETGKLVVFGDKGEDLLIDGAMASTAVPPYYPPWQLGECRYLDGGIYANLPIRVALERGATQVLALKVSHAMGSKEMAYGVMGIGSYSISLMGEAQAAYEIAWARATGGEIRVIQLPAPIDVSFWDYTQAARLIQVGNEVVSRELELRPLRKRPRWWLHIRRRLCSRWLGSVEINPLDDL
jgi:NTE family protein